MNASSTQRPTRRVTVARLVGSVGVLGAAAAVAGTGTFGAFTDSTTPVNTDVAAGTVSVTLSPAANYRTVPMTPEGLLPGDSTDPHAAEVAVARLRDVGGRALVQTVVKRGYRLSVAP